MTGTRPSSFIRQYPELQFLRLPPHIPIDANDYRAEFEDADMGWAMRCGRDLRLLTDTLVGRYLVGALQNTVVVLTHHDSYQAIYRERWPDHIAGRCVPNEMRDASALGLPMHTGVGTGRGTRCRIFVDAMSPGHSQPDHPSVTTLCHELAHALRAALGVMTAGTRRCLNEGDPQIGWPNLEEFFAVAVENMLREELGLWLRVGYGERRAAGVLEPPDGESTLPGGRGGRPSMAAYPDSQAAQERMRARMEELHSEPAMQGFMYELAGLSHRYNPFRWRARDRYGFLRPTWHDIEGQQSREWD